MLRTINACLVQNEKYIEFNANQNGQKLENRMQSQNIWIGITIEIDMHD